MSGIKHQKPFELTFLIRDSTFEEEWLRLYCCMRKQNHLELGCSEWKPSAGTFEINNFLFLK